jgi:hypothetical protein
MASGAESNAASCKEARLSGYSFTDSPLHFATQEKAMARQLWNPMTGKTKDESLDVSDRRYTMHAIRRCSNISFFSFRQHQGKENECWSTE